MSIFFTTFAPELALVADAYITMHNAKPHNALIFSKIPMGGGKIRIHLLLFVLLALLIPFFAGYRAAIRTNLPLRHRVHHHALYHDADSLRHFAERALLYSDPDALYITAMAAYLKSNERIADSLPTVPLLEADRMCMRAAAMGHAEALEAIRVMQANGEWPEEWLRYVPLADTPWQLAAALADYGTGLFLPERVEQLTDKAYIRGWLDTRLMEETYTAAPYEDGRVPAVIICDLSSGRVTFTHLQSEILGIE